MPATRLSRYEFAPVEVDDSGRTFLDVPDPIPAIRKSTDLRGIASDRDTPFSFAWKAYRELLDRELDIRPTSFWDVVAEVNGLVDAVKVYEEGRVTFDSGQRIRVPSPDDLTSQIRVPPAYYSRFDSRAAST